MANASFASLHAGLLARKGEAKPSADPKMAPLAWQHQHEPVAVPPPPTAFGSNITDMKVRLQDVATTWPARKPVSPIAEDHTWVATKAAPPLDSFGHPVKATVRLTHAQARAVKLAALVLDRPQQEIISAALVARLETLACTDLANCNCFKAVVEGLAKASEPKSE